MPTDDFVAEWEDFAGTVRVLPAYPKTLMEFVTVTRPTIDGGHYSFIPYQYWIPIMRSKPKRLALLFARQLFKTTYLANKEAFMCIAFKNKSVYYVAPTEDKLTKFADEKFRDQTLAQNPVLRQTCRGPRGGLPGRRGKVEFLTRSYWYGVTDNLSYGKVEGGSADEVHCDEIQLHDLAALSILKESMSKKMGNLVLSGIGGEGGSIWETEWLNTSQCEWHSTYDDGVYQGFDGQAWRKDLEFGIWEDYLGNMHDGLIYGNYMKDICRGEWLEKAPENYVYPGYHLSQVMACHIPLTIRSAMDDYKVAPDNSIEYKVKNYPQAVLTAHVFADFYKAVRRPITRKNVMACMEPYRYLQMFTPAEVLEYKTIFPERVQLFMGIDWGSGGEGTSQTVISIIMKWRGINQFGQYSADYDRYFLVFLERLQYEMSEDMSEAYYAMELFNRYCCDYGTADIGFGAKQVNAIIMGGIDPKTHETVTGLSFSKFIGCWTRGKPEEVDKLKPEKFDEEGSEQVSFKLMDKTAIIDNFVDMVKWRVPHPAYLEADDEFQAKVSRMKLALPYADEWKVDHLVKDFTSITRKDIEEDITLVKPIGSQKRKKEYNHPPDTVVSLIHCFVADTHFNQSGSFGGTWSSTRKRPGTPGPGTTAEAGIFRGSRR